MAEGADLDLTPPSEEPPEGYAPTKPISVVMEPPKDIELRGVGNIRPRSPIGCVLELLRRRPTGDGKTEPIPPFQSGSGSLPYAWAIMTATTVKEAANRQGYSRSPHPAFALFNTAPADKAQTIRCKIVHWWEEECLQYHLGAFMPPVGKGPPAGWWCRGDAKRAIRWTGSAFKEIVCPGRMCEFQQPKFGRKQDMEWCKPNVTLIAQFSWPEGNPLPKTVFQWQTKGWNNVSALIGMFKLIQDTAGHSGLGRFPVFALPFTLSVSETHRKNRVFPQVSVSVDGDLHEWMAKVSAQRQAAEGHPELAGPIPLRQLPPPGVTQQDVDEQSEARLLPFRPANARGLPQDQAKQAVLAPPLNDLGHGPVQTPKTENRHVQGLPTRNQEVKP